MQGRTKILVVDDERLIASTLAKILEYQGYETATAFSGEEAVHAACSFRPDFLLSDISMGDMNGIDAAKKILEFLPLCKVLFVSGHFACQQSLEGATAHGFGFEILSKPVPPPELLEKISQILAFHPIIANARDVRKPPVAAMRHAPRTRCARSLAPRLG